MASWLHRKLLDHLHVLFGLENLVVLCLVGTAAFEREPHLLDYDVEVYRSSDPELPTGIALYDDLVGIGGFDESGSLQAVIESRADPVVEWLRSTYEAARSDATPLTPDKLMRA